VRGSVVDLKDIKLYVDDRPEEGAFRVHRDLFADAELFELEQKYIFERTWGFLAFESQLAKPHDFTATHIGRVPVMVTRDAAGKLGVGEEIAVHAERALFGPVVHVELDVLEIHDRSRDGRRLCGRLAAVRLEARLAPEERRRLLQVLLPEQRLHEDIERLVLDGELVYVIVVRSVIVHRPARGGEHEVPRGPFVAIARD